MAESGPIEIYHRWLAGRTGDMVDNSRENIINLAMNDVVRGSGDLFRITMIEDDEAAWWMSQNIPKIKSTIHYRPAMIKLLNRAKANSNSKIKISIEKMEEMIEILNSPPVAAPAAAALVSESAPAAAPAPAAALVSEKTPAPLSKEEAASTLTELISKHVNGVALRSEALNYIFILSSEEPPEKKREAVKQLTKIMMDYVNDRADRGDRLRAMYCISILRGNEGGYRQRTKHSKKHSKKSRKSKKSKKSKRH